MGFKTVSSHLKKTIENQLQELDPVLEEGGAVLCLILSKMNRNSNSFENYMESEKLQKLFEKANIYDKEVLKRYLGFSSALLGKGRTRAEHLESAVKLRVSVFVRDAVEAQDHNSTVLDNREDDPAGVSPNKEEKIEKTQYIATKEHVCRDWAANRCRRGNSCKFGHPDLCEKFTRFGPACKTNPRGCDRKCGLFHPKNIWCYKAIKYGECKWGKKCKTVRHLMSARLPIRRLCLLRCMTVMKRHPWHWVNVKTMAGHESRPLETKMPQTK